MTFKPVSPSLISVENFLMVVLYPQNINMWIERCHHYGSDLLSEIPTVSRKTEAQHAELEGVKHIVKVPWQAALYRSRCLGPRAGRTMINPSL